MTNTNSILQTNSVLPIAVPDVSGSGNIVFDWINNITQLSPILALFIFLVFVGTYIKRSPIPDWYIPIIIFLSGMVIYPFIAEIGGLKYNVPNPLMLKAIFGGIVGGASIGAHQLVKQWTKKKFGINIDGGGDTKIITRVEIEKGKNENNDSNNVGKS